MTIILPNFTNNCQPVWQFHFTISEIINRQLEF